MLWIAILGREKYYGMTIKMQRLRAEDVPLLANLRELLSVASRIQPLLLSEEFSCIVVKRISAMQIAPHYSLAKNCRRKNNKTKNNNHGKKEEDNTDKILTMHTDNNNK